MSYQQIMQFLELGQKLTDEAASLAKRASQQENWFHHGVSTWVPGDDPKYVLESGTIRAVFTWTKADGRLFRHLSVSTPTGYPHPMIVFTLAYMLGFTDASPSQDGIVVRPPDSWAIGQDDGAGVRCVVVQQTICQHD